jgi:putative phosphoesterase
MKLLVFSDIHANLTALQAIIDHAKCEYEPDGIVLLGDIINYGMRPNEVITELEKLSWPVLVNIWGNHERSLVMKEDNRFSSERGKAILHFTESILTPESYEYINNNMAHQGFFEMRINDKKVLFVHGNIEDPFWGKLSANMEISPQYSDFDYVVSGHSHIPHYFEYYFASPNELMRNKKKTIFLNPGSIGQPRNHNSNSQYLYIDFDKGTCHFNSVKYDISLEEVLYPDFIHNFYRERLHLGI